LETGLAEGIQVSRKAVHFVQRVGEIGDKLVYGIQEQKQLEVLER
jgi:hypothetical protein